MINAYKKYAFSRTASTAEQLWDAVLHYDFANYPSDQQVLKEIWDRAPLDISSHYLKSNGTTGGIPTSYAVGPLLTFWLERVEWFIKFGVRRGSTRPYVVYLQEAFPHLMVNKPSFGVKDGVMQDAFLSLDFTQPELSLPLLEKSLKQCHEQYGKFMLLGQPSKYLHLLTHPEFASLMTENSDKFTMISSDWEPLFPKRFWFNNQMINWVTMANFYTCRHNTLHSLPLFLKTDTALINLLNFATKRENRIDDLVSFGERRLCQCGKWYLPFKMVPHVSYAVGQNGEYHHNTDLADSLKSAYYMLQFVQVGNKLDVLYSHQGEFRDEDLLRSYWTEKGYQVAFCPRRFLYAGQGKTLPFMNNRGAFAYHAHNPRLK
jgi:hypothetical protein